MSFHCLYTPEVPGIYRADLKHEDLKNTAALCAPPSTTRGKLLHQVFQGMSNGDIKMLTESKEQIYVIRSDYIVPQQPAITNATPGLRISTYIQWNSTTDGLRLNIIVPDPAREGHRDAARLAEINSQKLPVVAILAQEGANISGFRVYTKEQQLLRKYLKRNGVTGDNVSNNDLLVAKIQFMKELYDLVNQGIPKLQAQLDASKKTVRNYILSA